MTTHVLVPVYSMQGHTLALARAVAEGAGDLADTEVRVRRIAEFAELRAQMAGDETYQAVQRELDELGTAGMDDLRWAHGIVWGSPTRYGNMTAQMKQLIDATGELWKWRTRWRGCSPPPPRSTAARRPRSWRRCRRFCTSA
jgi:NAD(P)H dehydrogenase (quinone)